jgi:hypothetical protein
MVDVNLIWNNVRDLSRKDHAGYISTDEFNRTINLAQKDLFDYYLAMYEKTGRFAVALAPFRVQVQLNATSAGVYPLPQDYRQWCEAGVIYWNNECGGGSTEFLPAEPLRANEKYLTLSSPIRKPSMANGIFKYQIIADLLYLFPTSFQGQVQLEYLKNPPDAVRGYTLNFSTFEEDYNPLTTTNLIWPESETSNFTDLILFYKGIVVQSTPILSWVATKKQLAPMPESVALSQGS